MIDVHIHMVGGDKSIGFDDTKPPLMRTDPPAVAKALSKASPRRARRCGPASRPCARSAVVTTTTSLCETPSARDSSHGPRMLAPAPASSRAAASAAHLEPDAGVDNVDDAVYRVRQLVERGVDVIKIVSADGPGAARARTGRSFRRATRSWPSSPRRRALGRLKAAHAMGTRRSRTCAQPAPTRSSMAGT